MLSVSGGQFNDFFIPNTQVMGMGWGGGGRGWGDEGELSMSPKGMV